MTSSNSGIVKNSSNQQQTNLQRHNSDYMKRSRNSSSLPSSVMTSPPAGSSYVMSPPGDQHSLQQQQQQQQQINSYYYPSEYFGPFGDILESDDGDDIMSSESNGPMGESKRERLEKLFDGHKIKNRFDVISFLLRFLLFILILTKFTLITTLLIQSRLFEVINHHVMSETSFLLLIVAYFILNIIFLLMLPVPDNKCGCHFFIVLSLTSFSSLELILNNTKHVNSILKITSDLDLVSYSVTCFSILYLCSLLIRICAKLLHKIVRKLCKRTKKVEVRKAPLRNSKGDIISSSAATANHVDILKVHGDPV